MRKAEIACYKQFLLFSQRFPQPYICRASKCGIAWLRVYPTSENKFWNYVTV